MITVTRSSHIEGFGPEEIFAMLSDPKGLTQLLPRVRKAELLNQEDDRAKLITYMALGGVFGTIRCEGELTWEAPHTILFTVQRPLPVETRWSITPTPSGTQIEATIQLDLSPMLGPMTQFVPQDAVAEMMAKELDSALKAINDRCARLRLRAKAA